MIVYVIVVTYKGLAWVDKCFGSLRKSEIPIHVISIDNASNDGTVEKLQKDYPEVDLVINEKNIGFGRANNIGIKRALENNADYLILMNQDAQIKPDTIKGLVDLQMKNSNYDILSPVHLSKEDEVDKNFIISLNQEIISDLILGKTKKSEYKIKAIHAAFWLMTRKCIEEVGGFDPLFFYRGEDNDYAERCNLKNINFGVSLDHFISHEGELERPRNFTTKELVYRKYVEYLIILKTRYDRKLWRVFRRVFVQLIGEIIKSLLNFNAKLIYINSKVLIKIALDLPRINRSRIISMNHKKAFL